MAKDVKVQIVGDASKYKAALADAGSASDKFANKTKTNADQMSKFGLGALAVAGAVGVGMFKAGEAASSLGESINAVQVTFGKSAAGILKLGEEAADSLNLSNVAFNKLAVQFSSFANTIAGKGGDVVRTMEEMTGRAGDFASVMDIDVAEAARLFQSGLAGETEPLKKFGIDLSAAAVKAYAAANGIGALGKELTEGEKVQARYGLLMESTSKTQGDLANTADSAANQMRHAGAEAANAAASLGEVLAPILATVAGKAADLASGIVSLNKASGGAVVAFGGVAAAGIGLIGIVASVYGRVQKMREIMYAADGSLTLVGKSVKGLTIGLGLLAIGMYAMGQNAKSNAEDLQGVADAATELSRATDAQVMFLLSKAILQGDLAGKSLADTMGLLARTNIEGARRTLELAEAQGVDEKITNALRQAIADETTAVKQAATTTAEQGEAVEETTAQIDYAKLATDLLKGATEALAKADEEAKRKSDAFAESLEKQREKSAELYSQERSAVDAKYAFAESTRAANEDVATLTETLKKHKEGTDEATAATDAAKASVLKASEDYATLKGAAIDSESGIRRQIDALSLQAASLAPGSPLRTFLDQYIADLKAIPSNVSTNLALHVSSDATNRGAPGYVPRYGVPGIAEGGIVKASPGGTLAVIGEGGHDEAVIPLDGKHNGGGGGVHIENLTVVLPPGSDGDTVIRQIEKWRNRNGNTKWMAS